MSLHFKKTSVKKPDPGILKTLTECIAKYRESRKSISETIWNLANQYKQMYPLLNEEIVESLRPNFLEVLELKDEVGAKEILLNSEIVVENPALAIIGEVKSGKSRLINTLLRRTVTPQSAIESTRRIIRICYSKSPYYELFDKNNHSIKHVKGLFDEKLVFLNQKQILDESEVRKYIVTGVDTYLGKCGIDLIDTPGLSQSDLLNNISQGSLKNLLPLTIYVIDGRKQVKQSDINHLYDLKYKVPGLTIIYFISHLDYEEISKTKSPEMYEIFKVEADQRMKNCFKRLQQHNFIPHTIKCWQECDYFHGVSLNKYYDFLNGKSNQETRDHQARMKRFEHCLFQYFEKIFKLKIVQICDHLNNFQVELITKLLHNSQQFSKRTNENLKLIETISQTEYELFSKISETVNTSKNDLTKRLMQRLITDVDLILNPINKLQYPDCLNIPEDGRVKDESQKKGCRLVIIKSIVQGLEEVVKAFVNDEFFKKYENLIAKITDSNDVNRINRIELKLEKNSYMKLLEDKIKNTYNIPKRRTSTPRVSFEGGLDENFGDMNSFVNLVLCNIKTFLSEFNVIETGLNKIRESSNCEDLSENFENVNDSNWKLMEAKNLLKRCDNHNLAECVCENLLENVREKHAHFREILEREKVFIKNALLFNFESQKKFNETSPQFFINYLKVLSVKYSYHMMNVNRSQKKEICRGGQSKVYEFDFNGVPIVEKLVQYNNAYSITSIAEEVYYSRQFMHYRLINSLGAIIDETNQSISIFFYKMQCDLKKYLDANYIVNSRKLDYAIQIAEGIQYLHDQGIIHRDLKLSNILVGYENDVYLSDYGFCKSEALLQYSTRGTAIHTAPEILLEHIYTRKVDIFSFGVLLWYLFEGTGKLPAGAESALTGTFHVWNKSVLADLRPERREAIPDSIWKLMVHCWDKMPSNRPDIDYVLRYLRDLNL